MISAPDQQIWWRGSDLDEHTRAVLAAILKEAAAGRGPKTDNRRKIGDYYASCLDEAAIDAKGLKPFMPELDRIAVLKDKKELAVETARLQLLGAKPMFLFSSAQDYTDEAVEVLRLLHAPPDEARHGDDMQCQTGCSDISPAPRMRTVLAERSWKIFLASSTAA